MYIKRFDEWNNLKKNIDHQNERKVYVKKREIWWCSVGANIGKELDGKGETFARPILVMKKLNNQMVWGVPLSTVRKDLDYYHNFTSTYGKAASAVIGQLRLYSTKRLTRKVGKIDSEEFQIVKLKLIAFLS